MKMIILIQYACIFMIIMSCGSIEKSFIQQNFNNEYKRTRIEGPLKKYSKNIFKIVLNDQVIGTGFILKKNDQHLITSAHIALQKKIVCRISDCYQFKAVNEFGEISIGEPIIIDKALDFSALKFNWIKKTELVDIPIEDEEIIVGKKISLVGFSREMESFVISASKVVSVRLKQIKKPSFCYTGPTEKGHSGSPVFNEYLELVGIHFGSLDTMNCAIPISAILLQYSLY